MTCGSAHIFMASNALRTRPGLRHAVLAPTMSCTCSATVVEIVHATHSFEAASQIAGSRRRLSLVDAHGRSSRARPWTAESGGETKRSGWLWQESARSEQRGPQEDGRRKGSRRYGGVAAAV